MLNNFVGGCLSALCLTVFCSASVLAQNRAYGGVDTFSASDVFSSGAATGFFSSGQSPLDRRRIHTTYSHAESVMQTTYSLNTIGDVFAGNGPNDLVELNRAVFNMPGINDPFAPGRPDGQTLTDYYDATYALRNRLGTQSGANGDVFSSGSGSRKVAFYPANLPQLKSPTVQTNSGPRWDTARLPLKVYISGTVESARQGLIRDEIKSAMQEWYYASGRKLNYIITSRFTEADIYFVCQQTSNNHWSENIIETHNDMFDRVKVCFTQGTLLKLEPKRVRALCLHELGHAFGIMHHSNNQKDAMSLSATDDFHPIMVLTNGDRKLISSLYR